MIPLIRCSQAMDDDDDDDESHTRLETRSFADIYQPPRNITLRTF